MHTDPDTAVPAELLLVEVGSLEARTEIVVVVEDYILAVASTLVVEGTGFHEDRSLIATRMDHSRADHMGLDVLHANLHLHMDRGRRYMVRRSFVGTDRQGRNLVVSDDDRETLHKSVSISAMILFTHVSCVLSSPGSCFATLKQQRRRPQPQQPQQLLYFEIESEMETNSNF